MENYFTPENAEFYIYNLFLLKFYNSKKIGGNKAKIGGNGKN